MLALVSMTDSITTLPTEFLTAIEILSLLCRARHNKDWTKPLRGRWWCGSRVGLTDHPRCSFLAPVSTPLCESMEQLLTAANSISQRSIHDFSTTPHDRGHANPQLSSEYPKILCPTGLAVRAVLPEVTRSVGA